MDLCWQKGARGRKELQLEATSTRCFSDLECHLDFLSFNIRHNVWHCTSWRMTFKEVKNPGCMALNYKLTCSQSVTNITSSCLCYWSSKANKKQNLRQVQNFAKNMFGNKLVQCQLSLINLWSRDRFFQSTILKFLGNDDCMFLMYVIYKSIFSFQPPSTFLSLKLGIFVDFTLIWNSWNFCIFEPFSRFSWGQEIKYVFFKWKFFLVNS